MFGHVAEVAVRAIAFADIGSIGAGNLGHDFCQLGSAYAQHALIAVWKRAASQENRRACGIFER